MVTAMYNNKTQDGYINDHLSQLSSKKKASTYSTIKFKSFTKPFSQEKHSNFNNHPYSL
jgi:hypothetical protein